MGLGRRSLAPIAVTLLLVGVLVAAVLISGVASGGSSSGSPPTEAELKALPGHLAANSAQAGEIVNGSIDNRLAALRGIPVVVNQWASWCPNCKEEFPLFQQLSRKLKGKVAFLGLDSEDERGNAESFLRTYPVGYPSIFDSDASQASSIGGGSGWPTTFFYDRDGAQTYVREGGYVTAATLRADIEQYALGQGS